MAFHVGQLVVCVDPHDEMAPVVLEKGAIYTVREVGKYAFSDIGQSLFCRLEEVRREGYLGDDGPYGQCRFRPVTKRNQEIIEALLVPVKDTVRA